MKRNKKVLCFIALWCFAITSCAQSGNFTLNVELHGTDDTTQIYLVRYNEKEEWDARFGMIPIDTVASQNFKNGKAQFVGKINTNGNLYRLQIPGKKNVAMLLSKGERVSVKGNLNQWPDVEIIGSKGTAEMKAYQQTFAPLAQAKKTAEAAAFRRKFLEEENNSLYSAFVILMNREMTASERINAYKKLTSYVKNSVFGLKIAEAIKGHRLVQIDEKEVGSTLPDFMVNTPEGKKASVREMVSRSKYTLIDFWSSWCSPCISAFPKLKRTYDAFRDKGFNIIGISSDKNADDWKKALADYDAPWLHGLDNVENAGQTIFGMYAIPGYILVDQQGKIIQTDYFTGSGAKIKKSNEKYLNSDLFEIIEALVKK